MQPQDLEAPAEAPAFLLPLDTRLFAGRAERFRQLAAGHPLQDWLEFLAALSRAQQAASDQLPPLPLPDAASLARARSHGMPPLDAAQRPAQWREVLRQLAADLLPAAPAASQAALLRLQQAEDAELESLAAQLLDGELRPDDLARLPVVAAALQVVYTRLASQLDGDSLQKLDSSQLCPCCGSPAVSSIVRLGSSITNLRYLHCSLCNSEWNLPRAVCTCCGSEKEVALQELQDHPGPVRAETCDHCHSYLKIVYQEKDPQVDPIADDLASLSLDILVDEAGYLRAGPNLLLLGTAAA